MTHLLHKLQPSLLTVLMVALVVSTLTSLVVPSTANAATLTSVSMTLGSSKPSTATNMRILLTTATQLTGDITNADDDAAIFVRLPTNGAGDPFTISGSLVAGDILLSGAPANVTVNSIAVSNRGGSAANDTIKIKLNMTNAGSGINITASTALTIDIVNNRITTPAKVAASGTADIWQMSFATEANDGTTDVDTAGTQVATIDATTVSATVNTTLTFSVAAIGNASAVFGITTDAASTATTVPFGVLAPNTAKEVAQRLTIVTNAPSGYDVFVVQDQNLTAGSDDIDAFKDGTRIDDSADETWKQPAVVASSEATYGHMGYGSTDTDVFSSNQWAGVPSRPAAGSAPSTLGLACNNSAATTSDTCDVVYKVEISALQEAGSYTNEITYVVVPKY